MNSRVTRAASFFSFHDHAVVSTHSHTEIGFPSGSLIAYDVTEEASAIFALSPLAEHYKNICADARCCLTVVDRRATEEMLAFPRLRLLGHAELLSDQGAKIVAADRYWKRFSGFQSEQIRDTVGYFRFKPTQVYFIEGFGAAHLIPVDSFTSVPLDLLAYRGLHDLTQIEKRLSPLLEQFSALAAKRFGPVEHISLTRISLTAAYLGLTTKTELIHLEIPVSTVTSVDELITELELNLVAIADGVSSIPEKRSIRIQRR